MRSTGKKSRLFRLDQTEHAQREPNESDEPVVGTITYRSIRLEATLPE